MQNNQLPLVSIIMPAYNAQDYIKQSIQSVVKQTYNNWELLIINDGSTDNTVSIVESFKDTRIVLFSQENSGVSRARNYGISKAKGDYIAFLDSDDLWKNNKLNVQVSYMKKHPDIVLSYTDYDSFKLQNEIIKNKQLYPFQIENQHDRLLVFNYIATLTVMLKKEIFQKVDGFDISLFGPEDWDLWIRIAKIGKIAFINQKLALYREHESGISKNRKRQLEQEYKVLRRYALQSTNKKLQKYALWFYYLKYINYLFSQKNYLKSLFLYMKLFWLMPLKKENYTYLIQKIL